MRWCWVGRKQYVEPRRDAASYFFRLHLSEGPNSHV